MLLSRFKFGKEFLSRHFLLKRYFNDITHDDIPEVSSSLIKKIMNNNNLQFDDGYTCFITSCFLCKTNLRKSANTKLYINKTTGDFIQRKNE